MTTLRPGMPHVQPISGSSPCSITQISGVLQPIRFDQPLRTDACRPPLKSVFDLSLGRLSVFNQEMTSSSEYCQHTRRTKRSRVAITFVPSPAFWQTIVHLEVEWTARFDYFLTPKLSLQLLDIVRDDHPLIRASARGDLETLKRMLSSQNVSPLCSTNTGWTPLHFAAAYGHLGACKLLIAQGAPLNATGFRGITPLHLAAHLGRLEIFKALIKAGSDPDTYHEHGLNATFEILSNEMVSGSSGLVDLIKWLLQ